MALVWRVAASAAQAMPGEGPQPAASAAAAAAGVSGRRPLWDGMGSPTPHGGGSDQPDLYVQVRNTDCPLRSLPPLVAVGPPHDNSISSLIVRGAFWRIPEVAAVSLLISPPPRFLRLRMLGIAGLSLGKGPETGRTKAPRACGQQPPGTQLTPRLLLRSKAQAPPGAPWGCQRPLRLRRQRGRACPTRRSGHTVAVAQGPATGTETVTVTAPAMGMETVQARRVLRVARAASGPPWVLGTVEGGWAPYPALAPPLAPLAGRCGACEWSRSSLSSTRSRRQRSGSGSWCASRPVSPASLSCLLFHRQASTNPPTPILPPTTAPLSA